MSNSLSGTTFGFGLTFLVAAIVGGGLSLFGVRVPVLKTLPRQILLGAVGAILIVSSDQWSHIEEAIKDLVDPVQIVTEKLGPATLDAGATRVFPVSMSRHGPVDVSLQSVLPDLKGFTGAKGLPGQDGLFVTVCGAHDLPAACTKRQMGASDTFSKDLPSGTTTISVFNFANSPRMTFVFLVNHPK
ncbi:hypothetical protein [Paraburkholderia sp. SIMBA_054]|uniref:hypothetical protein n=1 Tax=Paraburkholderia sp. SIMBA_054 TaxID=3085795 RepID=UPI00397C5F53